MPNVELAKRTLAHIEKLEELREQGKTCERWNQEDWGYHVGDGTPAAEDEECGTAMCFAGWACKLAGVPLVLKPVIWRSPGYCRLFVEGNDEDDRPGISEKAAELLDLPWEDNGFGKEYDTRIFGASCSLDDLRFYVARLEDGTYSGSYPGDHD